MLRAPFGALNCIRFRKKLERGDVRRLQALVALHDVERDALTFGQRLVAVTCDGREVDEHVRLAVAPLDEAISLLVREPLDRAFRQNTYSLLGHKSPLLAERA